MMTIEHVELRIPAWQVDLTDRPAGGERVDGIRHVKRWGGEYIQFTFEGGDLMTVRRDDVLTVVRRRTCSMCVEQAVALITEPPLDEPELADEVGGLVCEYHRQHVEFYGFNATYLDD